jgi:hypothetical protein
MPTISNPSLQQTAKKRSFLSATELKRYLAPHKDLALIIDGDRGYPKRPSSDQG